MCHMKSVEISYRMREDALEDGTFISLCQGKDWKRWKSKNRFCQITFYEFLHVQQSNFSSRGEGEAWRKQNSRLGIPDTSKSISGRQSAPVPGHETHPDQLTRRKQLLGALSGVTSSRVWVLEGREWAFGVCTRLIMGCLGEERKADKWTIQGRILICVIFVKH